LKKKKKIESIKQRQEESKEVLEKTIPIFKEIVKENIILHNELVDKKKEIKLKQMELNDYFLDIKERERDKGVYYYTSKKKEKEKPKVEEAEKEKPKVEEAEKEMKKKRKYDFEMNLPKYITKHHLEGKTKEEVMDYRHKLKLQASEIGIIKRKENYINDFEEFLRKEKSEEEMKIFVEDKNKYLFSLKNKPLEEARKKEVEKKRNEEQMIREMMADQSLMRNLVVNHLKKKKKKTVIILDDNEAVDSPEI
jgi:hypothetical protein